jgi:hypothetical protein
VIVGFVLVYYSLGVRKDIFLQRVTFSLWGRVIFDGVAELRYDSLKAGSGE